MGSDYLRHGAIMLAAGVGIPLLAALNAQLGQRLAAPVAAAVVLFSVALLMACLALAVSGQGGALRSLPTAPRHLFLGGVFIAFYVLSVTWVAPRFGVGNAIFCVLLGQMLSAAVIDHFALFGALHRPLTAMRLSGLALMAGALVLIQKG